MSRVIRKVTGAPARLGAVLAACIAVIFTTHQAGASVTHRATPCSRGHGVASACQLVTRYFDALNRGDEARAYSLLGTKLLRDAL
jgi:hypothetical protein